MAGRGPCLELADVLRRHGEAFRRAHDGRLGRGERRVLSAIEACRTASLGGHVEACEDCGSVRIAYNSCRNRHCPKCQGAAREEWLAARRAELLDVPYFHVVFTMPAPIAAMAFQNKAVVYAILFSAAARAMTELAANPRRLGANIGFLAILHTWGQTLTHHPHIHCVVPGGGLAKDGRRWIAARPAFFLAVRPLAKLFRRMFLDRLSAAFAAGRLNFFGDLAALADGARFGQHIAAMQRVDWVVYCKKPFGGPERALAYLGRYTHRVAIANSRLLAVEDDHVAFSWKDYRAAGVNKVMRLAPDEFIRRFLLHVLPDGFHRIRHFGFMANGRRAEKIALCRELIGVQSIEEKPADSAQSSPTPEPGAFCCRECGGRLRIIEVFAAVFATRGSRPSAWRCDTS
jgi:Putative transposase/Transposase zinc-binding domain